MTAPMDIDTIYDKLVSHAGTLGVFEWTATHEPKSAPGSGIGWALTGRELTVISALSTLSTIALRIEYRIRLYRNMLAEPQDRIDPDLFAAIKVLGAAYAGDFDLDGNIFCVDMRGAYGAPFNARFGSTMQDGRLYRCVDLATPVILTDVWTDAGSET